MDRSTDRRWALLDNLRGLTLTSMILYHGCWDMVYIFGRDWAWYRSAAAFWWQQSICWTFILLSGFCFSLGRRPLRRGLEISAAGALVTAVTLAFMPGNRVVFGVLTFLGAAALLLCLLDKPLRRLPPALGLAGAAALFVLLRDVNEGYLGFRGLRLASLPQGLYRNLLTAFLGFPPQEFWSTDYFSLLPWFFLFLTGYFLFRLGRGRALPAGGRRWPLFNFLGRHSLLIYLLHQPVVYGGLWVLFGR